MAKVKITKPSATVAKKDNTRVARTRVNELVGDKPNYSRLHRENFWTNKSETPTKQDSAKYNLGFRDQIKTDKKAGELTDMKTSFNPYINQGREEAWTRRFSSELKPGALVRDSTIPLAPTQFPE
jgi:hypothetical protein